MSGEGIWEFALRVYAAPGVSAACIGAQDEAGADVAMLLWCAWAGAQGNRLGRDAVAAAIDAVTPWRDAVVRPLRAVRRALKAPLGAGPAAAVEGLRAGVKAAELEAERLQLELLAALPLGVGASESAAAAIAANLADCLALLGGLDPERLEPLARAAAAG